MLKKKFKVLAVSKEGHADSLLVHEKTITIDILQFKITYYDVTVRHVRHGDSSLPV